MNPSQSNDTKEAVMTDSIIGREETQYDKLRDIIGLAMFGFKYHDYILTPITEPRGKYPYDRAIADLDIVVKEVEKVIAQTLKEAKYEQTMKIYNILMNKYHQSPDGDILKYLDTELHLTASLEKESKTFKESES